MKDCMTMSVVLFYAACRDKIINGAESSSIYLHLRHEVATVTVARLLHVLFSTSLQLL